ncbi:MAG TPA: 6-pyruvoyl-tetrahydropterin synthase-related protein [bacterium]|nr:6-pyruvoyl-tetrahydropterin synthase-related protein [bacterium]
MPSGRRKARLLQVGLVGLILVPFAAALLRPGWIQSHEGLSYPMRLVEVARCWADGHWSARWFPDFYAGQGFPFLSFYAPLFFLLAGLGHAAGVSLPLALKLPVLLGALSGAAGAYRLARAAAAGRSAAIVAAALWTYAPYRVRDIWIRGDLTEFLAAGLLPWALLAMLRLGRRQSPRDILIASAAAALPIVTHNILGLLTGVLLAVTAAIVLAYSDEKMRTGWAAAAAGAGALLLSAFFWVPALYEKRFVRIDAMTTGVLDFRENFLSPADLVSAPALPGVGQALPMSFELGFAGLGLLALLPFAVRRLPPVARPAVTAAGAMFLLGLVMSTLAGWPAYQAFPLLRFVQFPWRFLNFVALGLAVLAAVGLDAMIRARPVWLRRGVAAAVVLAAVLSVRPLLGPKPNFDLPPWSVDPEEIASRRETTTSSEEYLPRWVTQPPMRGRSFDDGVQVDGEAVVEGPGRRVARYDLTITAEEPVTVTLRDLMFPGWVATVGGAPLALEPREGTGNMQFRLGAGRHEVQVRFGVTPVRRTAWFVSAAAALLAILIWLTGGPPKPRRMTRGYFSAGPHG